MFPKWLILGSYRAKNTDFAEPPVKSCLSLLKEREIYFRSRVPIDDDEQKNILYVSNVWVGCQSKRNSSFYTASMGVCVCVPLI